MHIMAEDPQFPDIPALGDILDRKKNLEEFKYSIVKCKSCGVKNQRKFKEGDYVFKKVPEEQCDSCKKNDLIISEIFCEWKQPEKKKK